jgi:hypothetical protein
MSGTRTERRGARDDEEYTIHLTDPERIAVPLLDENDRPTDYFRELRSNLERLGYAVEIIRN